ncbi:helix-turn-helix domain-containing protein [Isobaculum melis]|uniref:Cro/C1-type HTH DNA-binding domain-containing protein n=1 Tax=Isobaculum melis TaxID=142588 RepID=A0A1H9S6B3_9LACT|nr:helix-turn-helix domain-containing protein [Isobaculum melis]SER80537.1 Cro/C1-type HTH DNA-binding domain-containing protein [Isobaculum melis]
MTLLDVYLQRNGVKRYDVYKKTGISQQTLASAGKKSIDRYSTKILKAVAETLNKTPGTVLDELFLLEKEHPIYEAHNAEELLIAFKNKEEQIVIKNEFCQTVRHFAKSQLSETESLGFDLGGAGVMSILSTAVLAIFDKFSEGTAEEKEIEKNMRRYKIKENNKDRIVLSLLQLDY